MKNILYILCLVTFACSTKQSITKVDSRSKIDIYQIANPYPKEMGCTDPLAYVPDEHFIDQTIRVNVHFMGSEDKKVGFKKKKGKEYMYFLMKNANARLNENHKMELPAGNNTPNLKPHYQYRMSGDPKINDGDPNYFHYDDELYYFINKGKNRNNYNRDVIEKYEIGGDSILNIFVMPHHPDSVISKTYKPFGTGIALGSSLKIAGLVEHQERSWEYATLLNHEVGHVLGLSHTWASNDKCDDTPKHPNCWSPGEGDCAGPTSNNMMDYNHSQMAITPCQLGIVHKGFARIGSRSRSFLIPKWCTYDNSKQIRISKETHWYGARDVKHDIVVEDGAVLYVHCRLSMPKGSTIYVEPNGKLILNESKVHNSCGDRWKGIVIMKDGQKKGILELTGKASIEDTSQ